MILLLLLVGWAVKRKVKTEAEANGVDSYMDTLKEGELGKHKERSKVIHGSQVYQRWCWDMSYYMTGTKCGSLCFPACPLFNTMSCAFTYQQIFIDWNWTKLKWRSIWWRRNTWSWHLSLSTGHSSFRWLAHPSTGVLIGRTIPGSWEAMRSECFFFPSEHTYKVRKTA